MSSGSWQEPKGERFAKWECPHPICGNFRLVYAGPRGVDWTFKEVRRSFWWISRMPNFQETQKVEHAPVSLWREYWPVLRGIIIGFLLSVILIVVSCYLGYWREPPRWRLFYGLRLDLCMAVTSMLSAFISIILGRACRRAQSEQESRTQLLQSFGHK